MSDSPALCMGCKWNHFPYCFHPTNSYMRLDDLPDGFTCRAKEVEKIQKIEDNTLLLTKISVKLDKILKYLEGEFGE